MALDLEETNLLFDLIHKEEDIDQIYLYAKDPYEAKYQFLTKKRESTGLKHLMILKLLLNTLMIWMIFTKKIEECSPNKKCKILIVIDGMIVDMLSNKKLNPITTELFFRDGKLNISLVFVTQSYFAVLKNIRLNSKHYLIMKIPKK